MILALLIAQCLTETSLILRKSCYGDVFLELYNDIKFAVTNGRITKEYNDFTYVSTRGKSVVDYIFTHVDDLDKCINCKVTSITSIL